MSEITTFIAVTRAANVTLVLLCCAGVACLGVSFVRAVFFPRRNRYVKR